MFSTAFRYLEGKITDVNSDINKLGGILGEKRYVPASHESGEGGKVYILVKHVNAVAGVIGFLACTAAGTTIFEVTPDRSAGTGIAAGFYVSAPVADEYCWLLIDGYVSGTLTDGSVSEGQKVFPHATTDGGLDTQIGTTAAALTVGVGVAVADDAGTVGEIYCKSEIY